MTQTIVSSLPVSVNAIRVDGKKLTKSIFDQFRRRPFFESSYFENLELPVSQSNLPIIARHNFQVKERLGNLHYLYAIDGEIFLDDIDRDSNVITYTLKNIQEKIEILENQLKAAGEVIAGAKIDGDIWLRLTKGILFDKHHLFRRSIFDEETTEIECLESVLNSEEIISKSDFLLIFEDQNLTKIFRLFVNKKANHISSVIPNEIISRRKSHNSLKAKYELVMDRIMTVPQIVVGV